MLLKFCYATCDMIDNLFCFNDIFVSCHEDDELNTCVYYAAQ